MHRFYATNNLGGGGTNVSRFIIYLNEIENDNLGLLLNYYYLNNDFKKTMSFDQDVLRSILDYSNIHEFLNYARSVFITKNRIPNKFNFTEKGNIEYFLLDSGSGNLLRDYINSNRPPRNAIEDLIENYHIFSDRLQFNYTIALDYALKYTNKKGENKDIIYQELSNELVKNAQKNLELLKLTLKILKERKFSHKILAPLHGYDLSSFLNYLESVQNTEEILNSKFDGFALGGIADSRKLESSLWNVPIGLNSESKGIWIVSTLSKTIKINSNQRYLHILGAGNIKSIPFLSYDNVESSDCHSAWRRASDGDRAGEDQSKVLVPLFDEHLNYIDNVNIFEYVKINDLNKYNFKIMDKFTITEIQKLYNSASNEDHYFSKIIIFIHALYQYDKLIEFIKANKINYINKLIETPDTNLNNQFRILADLICK